MLETVYRTYAVPLSPERDRDLLACFSAMGLCAKNIGNTTHFLIKQVRSSYHWQGDHDGTYLRKIALHPLQQQVLDFVNEQMRSYNDNQTAKRIRKIARQAASDSTAAAGKTASRKPVAAFIPLQPFGPVIDKKTLDQMFDGKFLYAMVQAWDAHGAQRNGVAVPDTRALPGAMAQNVVFRVRDDYINHFRALAAYKAKPDAFTGRPKEPGYAPRHGRRVIEVDMSHLPGRLTVSHLPSYWLDYERSRPLPQEALQAYKAVSVAQWVQDIVCRYDLPEGAVAEQLRIVPVGDASKVEIVFSVPVDIDETSLAGQLMSHARSAGWYSRKTPDFLSVLASRPAQMQSLAAHICQEQAINMAGMDLGSKNLVAVGYHTGQRTRGMVVSAKRFMHRYNYLDACLDRIKSGRTPEAVKVLQKRQEQGGSLSKEDSRLIRKTYLELYADPAYLEALSRRTAYVQDTIHKLTKATLADLKQHGVQMLVIGKNVGWKQESDMGRQQNREFHAFPHARFIDVLRYKAFEAGILVLDHEEAYTSKSSFINNGVLPAYGEKDKLLARQRAAPTIDMAQPSAPPLIRMRDLLQGARGRLKRHQYVSRYQGRKLIMHADVNAAFNILRKVCAWLRFDPLRHHLRANLVGLNLGGFGRNGTKQRFTLIHQ